MKKSDVLFAVLTGVFLGAFISLVDWCRFFL